jgi:hypothetical protein
MYKNRLRIIVLNISLLLFLGLAVFLVINRTKITFSPWNVSETISWPVYAGGNGDRTAIIADSETAVIVLDSADRLILRLEDQPGKDSGFSSVQFAALDENNNLYILDAAFGGVGEENVERILKYSAKGEFLEELYAFHYINKDYIITKGKTSGVSYYNGFIYMAILEQDQFYLEQIPADKGDMQIIKSFAYPHAFRDLAYIHINAQTRRLAVTEKTGAIKQYDFDGTLHYEKQAGGETLPCLPWTAVSDKDNNLLYAEILSGKIMFLDTSTGNETVLYASPGEEGPYYHVNYSNGILFAAPYEEKGKAALFTGIDTNPNNPQTRKIGASLYSERDRLLRLLCFIGCILAVISLIVCVCSLWGIVTKPRIHGILKMALLNGICITFGAVISSVLIVNEMNERYNEKTYDSLENVSRLIAATVDTDLLQSFTDPAQSASEDYLTFKKLIRSQFLQLQFNEKRVYQTILLEKDGTIYMMYDTEDSIGTFFPFEKTGEMHHNVLATKQYEHSRAASAEGNWLFVMGPILDKRGEAAAFIETGLDLRSVNEQTKSVIWQTIIITGCSVILVLLTMVLSMLVFQGRMTGKK